MTPEGKAVAFMPSNVGLAPEPPELKVNTSAREILRNDFLYSFALSET